VGFGIVLAKRRICGSVFLLSLNRDETPFTCKVVFIKIFNDINL
jgi:hypothetical protein